MHANQSPKAIPSSLLASAMALLVVALFALGACSSEDGEDPDAGTDDVSVTDDTGDDEDADEPDPDADEPEPDADEPDADEPEPDADEPDADEPDAGDECDDGQTRCGETCVNINTNVGHCGACSEPCIEGFECDDGQCVCPDGFIECEGLCTESDDDECPEVEFVEVSIEDMSFVPEELTVEVGTTVRWTHNDPPHGHTVTSGEAPPTTGDGLFHSGNLFEGDTFVHTFDEAGEFPYFCQPHNTQMTAEVIVEEP